ncbi:MAG: AAA family ATPase [Deltaproteobacteria bacterium]|nr:AAA family ATPase [Deltaproteobacteria bacterium]MBW2665695.1 AAA family ATPase [Deltaproteobacteria bacterium]
MDANSNLPIDPFGAAVMPSLYVAREATERVLAELLACGRATARPAVILGPPGIGKSLLLQLVAERLEGNGSKVFLAYPGLDTEGLCAWILDRLEGPRFDDPVFAFEAYLCHLREIDSSLLLLIDDMSAMPLATVRWLGRRALNSKGELRVIASVLDDLRSQERIVPLGPACETILLEAPMKLSESTKYLRERLHHAGASEATGARFDSDTIAELHRCSGGNPREFNSAAAMFLTALPAVRV